jgi:hypothetical protein
VDDELKRQIAASMDLAADAEADARVVRAMTEDPAVEAWARGLYTVDHALRAWPEARRGEKSWGRMADRIRKRLEGAKGRGGRAVTPEDEAFIAAPTFDDDAAPPREQQITMSETNEHDADLEGLAALTRISQVPGAMPSTPPKSVGPSLLDAPDDTSSGLVDMKSLAQLTREAAASIPPPAPVPAAAPAAVEKPAPRKAEKTDDVMVKAKPAPVALPDVSEAPRKGGNTWLGALGGMAVTAAAFMFFARGGAYAPSVDSASQAVNAPAAPAVTAQPALAEAPAPSPTAATAPAQPTESAPAPPPPEAAPVPVVVAPAPEPTPAAVPAGPAAPAPIDVRHERSRTTTARVVAPAPAAAAPTPPPAPAAPVAQAAPARPAATAAPAAAAAPGGRPANVDDLINRAAGGNAAPAAAAPTAAAPAQELPERPTRQQITSVMGGLNSAVRACAQGQTGTAPVAVVIANDGSVRSASVSGQFAGGPIGECIQGVVNRAHFPAFRANESRVTWPFVILPPR